MRYIIARRSLSRWTSGGLAGPEPSDTALGKKAMKGNRRCPFIILPLDSPPALGYTEYYRNEHLIPNSEKYGKNLTINL